MLTRGRGWRALGAALGLLTFTPAPHAQPAAHLRTRWARDVTADRVLPEYPRPQMVRSAWTNLNGEWDYAVRPREAARPERYDGRILVPFAIESQLSGVGRTVSDGERLWYRRTFRAPARRSSDRALLHFGAVDWEATVFVNGREVGAHRGGYDPFTIEITDALGAGDQELIVAVWDPTDRGPQPRGKQVREPKSIWYTAVTGIWQTVWIEIVPGVHVSQLDIRPEAGADALAVRADVAGAAAGVRVRVTALDGETRVAQADGVPGQPVTLAIARPRRWSPSDPFLYRLRVELSTGDVVESYAGLRSIAVGHDDRGVNRLMLNGRPLFQYGLLDQGWWPDGLYTPPTDEAIRFDIATMKRLGFNLIRKHVKVEPERWYYECDRLGMLVWQDMPSGDSTKDDGPAIFARELPRVVEALRNHPSIVMWVPFNEGWGQHDTERYVDLLKESDPTRLVDNASGWTDKNVGDVMDVHAYPGPATPPLEPRRARVLGEFGGLGLPLEGHTWLAKGNWGYRSFTTPAALAEAYRNLVSQLRLLVGEGASAAIYTQTTDVEIEVNGIMTYDRDVVKLPDDAGALHAKLYGEPPRVRTVVPAADVRPETWRYTYDAPPGDWSRPDFDDREWKQGPGGFGRTSNARVVVVGTPWETPEIWLRRTFEIASTALVQPHLRIYHDDQAEVYLNGERLGRLTGSTSGYSYVPLGGAALRALRSGRNSLAVRARQGRRGQYVDAGLVEVIGPL